MVMKQEYVDATGESLIAGACLHYGCNEREGLAPHHVYRDHDLCESRANCTRVHAYQPHCFEYRDQDAPA